jgi:hypothetical protein
MNHLELATTFPEVKPLLKQMISEDRRMLSAYREKENEIKTQLIFNAPAHNRDLMLELSMLIYSDLKHHTLGRANSQFNHIYTCDDRLKNNQTILSFIEKKTKPSSGDDLKRAKGYPIPNLMEFNRAGFAPCPFHNEKTASLKYYPKTNSVHCFGCQKSEDAIGVAQHLMKLSFKETITWLVSRM